MSDILQITPIEIKPQQIFINPKNDYNDLKKISTPLIYNFKYNLNNINKQLFNNNDNINDNNIYNNEIEEENKRLIEFYEKIYKNPEEEINKLLEYEFPYINFDIDKLDDNIENDFPNEIIEYSLRPIITFDKEKSNLEERLYNESNIILNLKLTMEKITNLLENNDDEIIKILYEKIKKCPKDELDKRLKDPSRTKQLAELIIKNKHYIYLLWIKYYYKLYISLLFDYNNLLNKFINFNKSLNPNIDYFDIYDKYKILELQYKEIIDYFNDLKNKFINLQSAYKYMYNKNILKINSLKSSHLILKDKFLKLYEKNINFEKQINLLSNQNKTLLDELTLYKKENLLLKQKIQQYKDLILSSTDLNQLKLNVSLLN